MKNIGIMLISFTVLLTGFFSGCVSEQEKLNKLSIESFNTNPTSINQGEYANLTWVVTGASSVRIDNGIGNVTTTGSLIIHPPTTTTYILTASNETSTKSATTTITISPPVIALGDCVDVNYICWYSSNNTIVNTSYQNAQSKTGGAPIKIFVSNNGEATSPKYGYTTNMIQEVIEGLIGMREGETKTIGPIPPSDLQFGVGAVFTSQYFAFGMDQMVRVTEYTSDHMSVKWINMENLGKITMPQLITNNLESTDESEMVIYPPPYYIWKNATSIISITDNSVTVETTPTKTTYLSDTILDVRDGEKQMLIFPTATTASWDDDTITIISEPIVGQNYTFQTPGYKETVTITVHINKIVGDKVNATITNDQSPEPSYLDFYKELTFNRIYTLPRYYNDIPTSYISYFYGADIERAGYSLERPLTYEVTVEKIYKTSISE